MHSPAVHRRLEQTEQAFHDLNSRGGLEGNDDQGGTRVASPTARCFHPPSKTPIPHNSPFRWEKRKNKHKLSDPRAHKTQIHYPFHKRVKTNKPSFTKTQLQGEIVGNDDRGGLGWPIPTARCFHPSTRPIPDNFPFQQSKRKTITSYIQTKRESPPALAPSTNDNPTTQQHSNDDDGQRQLSNTGTEKPLPKNHRQTNQGPQKKDIKARTLKERGCEFSYLPKTTRHSKGKRI